MAARTLPAGSRSTTGSWQKEGLTTSANSKGPSNDLAVARMQREFGYLGLQPKNRGSELKWVRDRSTSIVQGTAPEVDPAGFVHFRRKHVKEPALIVANYGTPPGAVARWLLVQTIIPVVRHRFRGKKVQLAA